MRRQVLIFGIILTLTSGVWSSALAAVADACCMNEASADAIAATQASDEHDCCVAKIDEPDAPHSESTEQAHEVAATHESASSRESQADAAHAWMDCAGAKESSGEAKSATRAAAFDERMRSCFACCAGRSNQMPTNAAFSAPEPNKVKRAAGSVSTGARQLFTPGASCVSHLAPSQHAPPAQRERRHILNSVFLI
jgi:hypothetical protein